MSLLSWMAWTPPVAIFFVCIGVLLAGMTVWELRSPTLARRGLLPLVTTRGDRLFIGLLAGGTAGAQEAKVADRDVADWVKKRVEDWHPTKDERRFDDIGWAADICTALKLARDHNRPVFLFTHDGRIAVGRC